MLFPVSSRGGPGGAGAARLQLVQLCQGAKYFLKIFQNLKIFLKVGDPTPPGVSDYSWTPVEGRIEDGNNQWYFNISGVGSAMDSSQEIFDRFQIWDQVLAEEPEIF